MVMQAILKTGRNIAIAMAHAILLPAAVHSQQPQRLPERDTELQLRFESVFTVGKEEGADNEVFSQIPSITFDAASNLYVLDRDNARVLVFGKDGRFVRQIGKQGEGPGEFRIPAAVAPLDGGRIAVYDMAGRNISVFTPDGRYESLIRITEPVGAFPQMRTFARGGVLLTGTQMSASPGQPPTVSDSLPILWQAATDDAPTRALVRVPSVPPVVNASGSQNNREVRVTPPPVFSPIVSWSALPDGRLAVSSSTDWRIQIFSPEGRPGTVLERPIRARAVSERDRQRAREQRRANLESGAGGVRVENVNGRERMTVGGGGQGIPPEQIERILASLQFAETVPVISGVRADPEGRIWIQREGGPGQERGPIDLIAPDGHYIGTIRGEALPDAFGPDGLVAWIQSDELGVQRVAVSRVTGIPVGNAGREERPSTFPGQDAPSND
jgi:hypothetical protein